MKPSSQPLRPSPYLTRRDPATGQWLVVKSDSVAANANPPSPTPDDDPPEIDGCR